MALRDKLINEGKDKMKILFWWRTNDLQSKVEEVVEVDKNISKKDLDIMAQEMFWEDKQPDWGWRKIH